MYVENIEFNRDSSLSCIAYSLGECHLHCHKNAIEILFLLKGNTDVKVAFEKFSLKSGDFIVIDKGDSHQIVSVDGECVAVSLHIGLDRHKERFPYIDYVWFTCESFDLVRYSNQTVYLRSMISDMIRNLLSGDEQDRGKAETMSEHLIKILIKKYDIRNYYNREKTFSEQKLEKYYKIMGYIYNHYEMKNLQDYISQQEFYSKSYITHIFKEMGGISFQDILTYERLSQSEALLLTTDFSINEIAEKSGFSDLKYYIRDFKKWFLCTPSKYRKKYQKEVTKEDQLKSLPDVEVLQLLEFFLGEEEEKEASEYKMSINPFSLKVLSAGKNEKTEEIRNGSLNLNRIKEERIEQQVLIRIRDNNRITRMNIIRGIRSFEEIGFDPVVAIYYTQLSVNGCRDTIKELVEILGTDKTKQMKFFIVYNDLGDWQSVSRLAAEGKTALGGASVEATLMV